MRLSQVFGISPEFAAQLEEAKVRTLRDLAVAGDLTVLSARSQVPLDLLEQWQADATLKVAGARRRRRALSGLVVVTALLLAAIAVWSYRRSGATSHYNRGNALEDKGDYRAAIAEYRKALALRPNYTEAHYNLGTALHYKGDQNGAIAEYRKALDLKPDYAPAHYNLGWILADTGKKQEAALEFQQAYHLNPSLKPPPN